MQGQSGCPLHTDFGAVDSLMVQYDHDQRYRYKLVRWSRSGLFGKTSVTSLRDSAKLGYKVITTLPSFNEVRTVPMIVYEPKHPYEGVNPKNLALLTA